MGSGGTSTALSSTAAAFDALDRALGAVAGLELSYRNPEELAVAVVRGERVRARVEAFVCAHRHEAAMCGLALDAGYKDVAQMVGDKTGGDAERTRADLRLGSFLDDYRELAEAFGDGRLTRDHVDLIRRSVHNSRTAFALQGDQQLFIEWAADYDFVDYKSICVYWKTTNDPDGAEPRDQVAATKVKATKQADGSVKVSGYLDPLTGAAFMTALDGEEQKLFRQESNADDGGPAVKPGKRSADALMNLVVRGAAREDGSQPEPLINIVMSESVAEDTLARIDDPSAEPLPLAFDDIDARCELIDGTPLHPNYVLAVMGTATFRRQIMTAASRSIDVSVNARCFTPWQKQALKVEARGRCQSAGCDSPFPWLEADHKQPHSRGGPTRLDNGQMLCGPHNRKKRNKAAA